MKKIPKWLQRLAKFASLNQYDMQNFVSELASGQIDQEQWEKSFSETWIILDERQEPRYSGSRWDCCGEIKESDHDMISVNEYLIGVNP